MEWKIFIIVLFNFMESANLKSIIYSWDQRQKNMHMALGPSELASQSDLLQHQF